MNVSAIRIADEAYTKKIAAYRACQEAGIKIPVELEKFFDGQPEDFGPAYRLAEYNPEDKPKIFHSCIQDSSDSSSGLYGILIDTRSLPPETRFVKIWMQFDC